MGSTPSLRENRSTKEHERATSHEDHTQAPEIPIAEWQREESHHYPDCDFSQTDVAY